MFTFSIIIYDALLTDNYDEPLPEDPSERLTIERANWWRAIKSCILYMLSYAYLNPYPLHMLCSPMERFWRVVLEMGTIYFCFILVMV
jgi:hypothetical protein